MEVQERNGVRIYSLSAGTSLPPWIGERARRNLAKRDPTIRHRVELIQDFTMPSSSSKLRQSSDGRYLFAAGSYMPRIRCYDLDQMSMKFERYLNGEPVDMTLLGEDYGKIAILLDDRSVALHAPYGAHDSFRVPSFGRAMGYEQSTCDLMIVSSAGEVYRFNLEEGRFKSPYSCDGVGGLCIDTSPSHALSAVGCEDGLIRFYDNRIGGSSKGCMTSLNIAKATSNYGFYDEEKQGYGGGIPGEVSSVAFDPSGKMLTCGTKGGCVPLYDLRSSKPLHVKEHQYGLPIHTVQFHKGSESNDMVMSADAKLVKIWNINRKFGMENDNDDSDGNKGMGGIVANVEGEGDFTHFIVANNNTALKGGSSSDSGLILCAGEQPRMQAFYCPTLGPAPKWCSFLDSITEELEEENLNPGNAATSNTTNTKSSVYEDYKFVTRDEVEQLGVGNLVGTPLLRGYMHGFFMDASLYSKVRAVAKPFEYEEYRKQKIKEKIAEKRASRIAPKQLTDHQKKKKKEAKVNTELMARLETKANKGTKKAEKTAKAMLEDDRFGGLFQNPDFEIDEEDINFKLRNASGVGKSGGGGGGSDNDMDSDREDDNDTEEGSVQEDEMESAFIKVDTHDDSGTDDDSESEDEDGFKGAKVRGEQYDAMKAMDGKKSHKKQSKQKSNKNKQTRKSKRVSLYEADDYADGDQQALRIGLGDHVAQKEAKRIKNDISIPLEERIRVRKEMEEEDRQLQSGNKGNKVGKQGVEREVTFIPKDSKKKRPDADDSRRGNKERGSRKSDSGGRERRSMKFK